MTEPHASPSLEAVLRAMRTMTPQAFEHDPDGFQNAIEAAYIAGRLSVHKVDHKADHSTVLRLTAIASDYATIVLALRTAEPPLVESIGGARVWCGLCSAEQAPGGVGGGNPSKHHALCAWAQALELDGDALEMIKQCATGLADATCRECGRPMFPVAGHRDACLMRASETITDLPADSEQGKESK